MSYPNAAELARNLTTYFIRRFEVAEIDKWKVSKLVASDGAPDPALSADASGYLTSAVQPLFSAYNSVTDSNVTGDGTVYTIVSDTEIFDVNSNYNNATGVFIAPVTGKYLLIGSVYLNQIDSNHDECDFRVVTSNRAYFISYCHAFNCAAFGDDLLVQGAVFADMDNADTASLTVDVGSGALVVDVLGSSSMVTFFQGYLLI